MTRDDAEEAMAALGRAIDALGKTPPDVLSAAREIAEAAEVVGRVANIYADQLLRPGLNKPQPVGSYAETQVAWEKGDG